MYPIPAKQKLNIQVQSSKTENVEIFITDISGKIIMKNKVALTTGVNSLLLNVASLKSGLYYLKLVAPSVTSEARKIIIQ